MKRLALIAAAAALVPQFAMAQAAAPAGDPIKGAQKVQMCQGCHGIEGWRTAFPEVYAVPRIAGQHPQYFVSALKAGTRHVVKDKSGRGTQTTDTHSVAGATAAIAAIANDCQLPKRAARRAPAS